MLSRFLSDGSSFSKFVYIQIISVTFQSKKFTRVKEDNRHIIHHNFFFLEHKSSTHLWRLARLLLFCSPHPRVTNTLELDSPTTTGSPHGTHLGFLRCTCHHYRTLTFTFQIMILSRNMVSSSTLRNHHYQGTTNAASVHQSARIPTSRHLSANPCHCSSPLMVT
jgi:hypothetical protein